jgi:quinol monooxygenase YgiN
MIAQIVISTAKPGVDKGEFRKLTKQMVKWLRKQPGFVSYEFFESKSGWADKIVWANMAAAKNGNKAFAQTTIGSLMENFLEPDYTGFMGAPVQV